MRVLQGLVSLTPSGGRISLVCDAPALAPSAPGRPLHAGASLVAGCWAGIMKAVSAELGALKRVATIFKQSSRPLIRPDTTSNRGEATLDVHGTLESCGVTMAPRLLPLRPCKLGGLPCKPSSTMGQLLITGGMGALGSLVASWLAYAMCRPACLHLLGRSGRPSGPSGMAMLCGPAQVRISFQQAAQEGP